MTEDELAAAEALCARATSEPWRAKKDDNRWDVLAEVTYFPIATVITERNAEFIAAARTGWPAALAEVRRLREALTELAAFDDKGANERFAKSGSYSNFDEPGAVQCAREALSPHPAGEKDNGARLAPASPRE